MKLPGIFLLALVLAGCDPHLTTPSPNATPLPGLDAAIPGKWDIDIPNGSYTSRTNDGSNAVDTTHTYAGATLGVIAIDASGAYVWTYPDGSVRSKGTLSPFVPTDPSLLPSDYRTARFWQLSDGERNLIFCLTGTGQIQLFGGTYLTYQADGTLEK